MPWAVFAGFAVTGLAAEGPQAHHALAAKHVGLDFLGFGARLELARALGIAGLACTLRIGKLERVGGAHFVVLEAAVQGAQVIFADVIGFVIEVQATASALATDVIVALFE